MIRFLPDNWRETILRPIAMAAPDAGVYIEIMAPDFRFAIALALVLALATVALFGRRYSKPDIKPVLVLTGVTVAAFLPWLVTTANGRYFIPFLLAIGPLCIALIYLLPTTPSFRLVLGLCAVGLQGFAVQQASPWQSWGMAQWKEAPYFQVDWPADLVSEPSDFVTLSIISYSLVAPQLPAQSRWMSLANAPAADSPTPDSLQAQKVLANARHIRLLSPALPEFSDAEGLPTSEVLTVIDNLLGDHRLTLANPNDCRLIRSRGIVSMKFIREALADAARTRKLGFWVCTLQRISISPAPLDKQGLKAGKFDDVFSAVEAQCPRFFPKGHTISRAVKGGELRVYSTSEMKLYVLDEGSVLYKYYRALNPVRIGTIGEILSGKTRVDCSNIRGRSGLPWEREI